MIILASIWAVATASEGLIYAQLGWLPKGRYRPWLILIMFAQFGVTAWLVGLHWQVFILPLLFAGYRVVNVCRYLARRLPVPQLSSVTLRAHIWLTAAQLIITPLAALIVYRHLGHLPTLPFLLLFQLLSAVVLLRVSLHTWRHTRLSTEPPALSDKELPSLSVLIPARNETDMLRLCLEQLVATDYPKLEILVLDDNSTNKHTPEIIRSFAHDGVRFVQSTELDESRWLAKNLAYERLRQQASGELLLFCGVDTRFRAQTLRSLVEALFAKQKDMLSVLPTRDASAVSNFSLLQPMRYYWELCLPRRLFKRPPVLSTCWLVRTSLLDHFGGFAAVSRSITPEATFARQAVTTDSYSFIRSTAELGVSSVKPAREQYATSVRLRYPQLHRRLELIALTTLLELVIFIGPILGLCLTGFTRHPLLYGLVWLVCLLCVEITYLLAAVGTRLNMAAFGWLIMPLAFLTDIAMQHISMYKYEFSRVEWKGRDATVPVMQRSAETKLTS